MSKRIISASMQAAHRRRRRAHRSRPADGQRRAVSSCGRTSDQDYRRLGLDGDSGTDALSVLKSLVLVAITTIGLLILDHFFALRHVTRSSIWSPSSSRRRNWELCRRSSRQLRAAERRRSSSIRRSTAFSCEDPQHLIELPLFVFVAIVTGHLATNLRRQADLARRRETEVQDLYAFSRRLAAAHTASDIYTAIREHLASIIGRRTILFETAAARRCRRHLVRRGAGAGAGQARDRGDG